MEPQHQGGKKKRFLGRCPPELNRIILTASQHESASESHTTFLTVEVDILGGKSQQYSVTVCCDDHVTMTETLQPNDVYIHKGKRYYKVLMIDANRQCSLYVMKDKRRKNQDEANCKWMAEVHFRYGAAGQICV